MDQDIWKANKVNNASKEATEEESWKYRGKDTNTTDVLVIIIQDACQ